jgi:hypothetical protein
VEVVACLAGANAAADAMREARTAVFILTKRFEFWEICVL